MNEYGLPEMLTLLEASQQTGLSYEHLRKLCHNGAVVHIKSGSKFFVNKDKLIEYLNGGCANEE